jgi:hypothetical protein
VSQTFNYVLTRDAFVAFNDRVFFRRLLPIYSAILGMSVLAVLFNTLVSHEPIWGSTPAFILVFLPITLPISLAYTRRAARKLYDESRWMEESRTVTFDDQAIAVDQPVGSTRLQWGDFARWIDAKSALELWPNRATAIIFPKASIPSEHILAIKEHIESSGIASGRSRKRLS